jgi:hypothetical protein
MKTLRQFYDHFHEVAARSCHPLWKYSTYETKLGTREEVVFIGSAAIFQMMPPKSELSLLLMQTKERRVYTHATYLMSIACPYFLEDVEEVVIGMYGQGYQAMLSVNNVAVTAYNAEGLVERVDRFGNSHEQSVSRVSAVTIRKLQQEQK